MITLYLMDQMNSSLVAALLAQKLESVVLTG